MKLLPGMVFLSGLCFAAAARPQEDKPSKTFAEILSRVSQRDPDSGAILRVRAREDSPSPSAELEISIVKGLNRGEVLIELRTVTINLSVFEKYLLKEDAKMREEMDKMVLLRQQAIERHKQRSRSNAEQIGRLTGGKLKHGMTEKQVIQVLGKPEKTVTAMAAGNFTLWYATLYASFEGNRLAEVSLRPKKE
jgi:hypothetical protein